MQVGLYSPAVSLSLVMPRPLDSIENEFHRAAGQKIRWLRKRAGLSQKALEELLKRRGAKGSQKSMSNLETAAHDSGIGLYKAVCAQFDVPLWVMFIPCEPAELLEPEKLRRVVKLMHDYLACDENQRDHIANMAAGFSALKPKK